MPAITSTSNHGLNVDAGIFVSYIGLFSYYNFDNWTYQPSFVSSNTPWFFNGLRVQWFPTQTLKIEPWLINGWQSYAKFNVTRASAARSCGSRTTRSSWCSTPTASVRTIWPAAVACPTTAAIRTPPSACPTPVRPYVNYAHVSAFTRTTASSWKYYDAHGRTAAQAYPRWRSSVTVDIGCEYGGGVSCSRGPNKENFLGVMAYDRTWFDHDIYAVTIGGGFMNNPGRYLALLPPINGATAATGTPYFTENPGQKLYQWDMQLNFQYMPKDWITWWTETTFRHSDVPYWSGPGGVTPPTGNNGAPGASSATTAYRGCGQLRHEGGTWFPDLRKRELIWGAGVMVRF